MTLEVPLTLVPMEALPVNDLPSGAGWLFEPKYDGFRCLLFRDGDTIHLQSRRQRPLGRYFPEVIDAAGDLSVERFVFDGELIIPDQPFDALQLRLHPAASRVQKLSREHPAQMVVFDLLADGQGQSLWTDPSESDVPLWKMLSSGSARHPALCCPRRLHLPTLRGNG